MAYKDKEKQKAAQREWVRQKRVNKGSTLAGSTEGIVSMPSEGIPSVGLPLNFGCPDCRCKHCHQAKTNGNKHTINHSSWKPVKELAVHELNRVSLPGDVDYNGVCADAAYDSHRVTHA